MSIANLIGYGEKIKNFFSKIWTRQGCSLLPILFNRALKVLARAINQEKEIKEIEIEKEEVTFSLCHYYIILYIENSKNSIY